MAMFEQLSSDAWQWRCLTAELGLDAEASYVGVVTALRELAVRAAELPGGAAAGELQADMTDADAAALDNELEAQTVAAAYWWLVVAGLQAKGWKAVTPQMVVELVPQLVGGTRCISAGMAPPSWAMPAYVS